jgi:hypothetical protein
MDRKSLRKKLAETLIAADIPNIGADVFTQRSIPNKTDELPVLLVYIKSSNSEEFDNSPKSYRKQFDVTFEIITVDDDDEKLADELDDMVEAVERTIEEDVFLEQNCESVQQKSSFTTTDSNGASPVGSTRINYTFEFIVPARNEDTELPDLNTVANNWELNNNGNNDAKEEINLSQE